MPAPTIVRHPFHMMRRSIPAIITWHISLAKTCETDKAHTVVHEDSCGPVEDLENRWNFAMSVIGSFRKTEKQDPKYLIDELENAVTKNCATPAG